tara:strand:- start:642 stop:803 length:162 start_codon:yes stop_codon:yes gene_type:complete
MVSGTIERLKKDSKQLGWSAERYRKQGKADRLRKVLLKKQYLDDNINELEDSI